MVVTTTLTWHRNQTCTDKTRVALTATSAWNAQTCTDSDLYWLRRLHTKPVMVVTTIWRETQKRLVREKQNDKKKKLNWKNNNNKKQKTYGGDSHFGLKQTQISTHKTRNDRDSHFDVKQTDLYGENNNNNKTKTKTRKVVISTLAWNRLRLLHTKQVMMWQPLWRETENRLVRTKPVWWWQPL